MRVIARLLVALAVAFPVSMVAAGVAHGADSTGSGPAVIKCMHWKDSLRITPGVQNTPADQIVSAHGKIYGCNKAGGGAQFTASFLMSEATCADLSMSGVAQIEWADGGHSTTFLSFHPQATEPRKSFVNGSVTAGAFQGLIVSAWVRFTEVFGGSGINCSSGNPLQRIRFSNSQSFQLLTPNVATTTVPTATTTPGGNTTVPVTNPVTVPVTNQGSTPNTSPVIVIHRGTTPVVVVDRRFPSGTLAFTGSSGTAAEFAIEALLIGGAFVLFDPERRNRRSSERRARRPKAFLSVTLPGSRRK